MNTIVVQGITVDFSGVTSDGWKWRGKIALSKGDDTVTARVISSRSAGDEIFIKDVEGDSDELCDLVDANTIAIERALEAQLGDPRGREARRQAREDQETEWAIDDRRMGL